MNLHRPIAIAFLFILGGCATTMHPDYQQVFYKQSVPPQEIEEVIRRFVNNGLTNAKISVDALGRLQLSGSYENEKEVELAFTIARGVVGDNAVSNVRPGIIRQKDWELNASEGFAKFIEDLARKFKMSVHVEQGEENNLIGVSDTGLDGITQFASNSSKPTSNAAQFYPQMAAWIASTPSEKNGNKRILIVGHTDDVGDTRHNAVLSEQRAHAVGRIFETAGISSDRIYYQGAGESLPVADNRTEEGRSRNRRVDIVDMSDDKAFRAYLASRQPKIGFYRPATVRETSTISAPTSKTSPKSNSAPSVLSQRKGNTSPAAPPSTANATTAATAEFIDFGGAPASTVTAAADFGKEITPKSGFLLISSAQASGEPVVPACSADRPRVSNGVKSLRDQKDISNTEYMPGLYNSSWMDTVNGNLVGLSNVAVYRDGGSPANKPNLYIYKAYKQASGAKPDFSLQPEVNAYRGDKAILYRVFVDGPVKCMDVLFPYDNSGEARSSNLFYVRQSNLYVAAFKPKLVR